MNVWSPCGVHTESTQSPHRRSESARSPQGQVGDCKVQLIRAINISALQCNHSTFIYKYGIYAWISGGSMKDSINTSQKCGKRKRSFNTIQGIHLGCLRPWSGSLSWKTGLSYIDIVLRRRSHLQSIHLIRPSTLKCSSLIFILTIVLRAKETLQTLISNYGPLTFKLNLATYHSPRFGLW
jgi:hypothetical protein